MTVMVVHGAKTVTRVHWEIIDAKEIMPKSFTILSALCFMMNFCGFVMAVVFKYVLMMNIMCCQSMHMMIPVEKLFL